jgi:hypothetical protein
MYAMCDRRLRLGLAVASATYIGPSAIDSRLIQMRGGPNWNEAGTKENKINRAQARRGPTLRGQKLSSSLELRLSDSSLVEIRGGVQY